MTITVGVLALQGAFYEHIQLLKVAAEKLRGSKTYAKQQWEFIEVRTAAELARCDGLIIPGGESTAMALVAARSNLLEPLRDFVKLHRKPTWGTCAGLILLAESANRTKRGGQDLIGGLDVRVNRNHFGRQTESFYAPLDLPFLPGDAGPFRAVFIRAPVVEKVLSAKDGIQDEELAIDGTVVAPSRKPESEVARKAMANKVEILGKLPAKADGSGEPGDIVAVKQGNVFGTSFHPELTDDARIHMWWLCQVSEAAKLQKAEVVVR
ncbi:glutamine amidotransferase subunit pdxT [Nannizzia gypsea CBS 118893]|uniref:glutaminase n=1 Tax=Arthroderma gypseum (strain ATCC MYA-4604 / CBS 118893) TaxID=535722 RepID=E4UQ19_ARTGP|nr:glutamine amidotransferase subunit pdxT [Nannizzia gypsea CBS 118893]EFQ99153.1 glutamine amidotransferase subunit pdxT [Nannizzia gypsea CBS 118893]